MKDIKVGVEKMTRNCRKMIEKTADSLLLSKHSIQLSALFLLLSGGVGEIRGRYGNRRGLKDMVPASDHVSNVPINS